MKKATAPTLKTAETRNVPLRVMAPTRIVKNTKKLKPHFAVVLTLMAFPRTSHG